MNNFSSINSDAADSRPTSHKAYLLGLNSLRAIAALCVCLYHFTNGALPKVIIPATKQIFSEGRLGVEIFFVISGFIIPYSLLGKNYHISDFLSYIKKRIIRINPPAYAAMLLVVGQWFLIDRIIQHSNNYTKDLSVMRIVHNMLFTIPFTKYSWIIGIFWTLAIEFQFYIFVGLLFYWLFETKHVWNFVLVFVLVGFLKYVPGLSSCRFFECSPLFALGGVALLWQQHRISKYLYVILLLLFTALAYYQLGLYVSMVGIGTALAINLLNISIPGLDFIGRISYSFYLLHVLIGTTCEFLLLRIIAPDTVAHKLLILVLALLAALAGAYIFYQVVERPFIKLASAKRIQ